jgi:hypothetical protein
MTTFTIDTENNITAFAHPRGRCGNRERADVHQSGGTDGLGRWLARRAPGRSLELVRRRRRIWRGPQPVKKFENRKAAVARIWKAIQRLNGSATSEAVTAVETAPSGQGRQGRVR